MTTVDKPQRKQWSANATEGIDLDAFIKEQKEKLAKDRKIVQDPANPVVSHLDDDPEETGLALDGYKYEEKRKNLLEEKKKEYNAQIARQKSQRRDFDAPEEETGLKLDGYNYQNKRKSLLDEKKKEYNDLIAKDHQKGKPVDSRPGGGGSSNETGLNLDGYKYEQRRKNLQEEKKNEYNALLSAKNPGTARNDFKENIPPPQGRNKDDPGIIGKLGTYESQKQKLQEERRKEYNDLLAEKNFRSTGKRQPAPKVQAQEPVAVTAPPASQRREPPGLTPDEEEAYFASLPGLRDHPSAEVKRRLERNREYNELLQAQKNRPRPVRIKDDRAVGFQDDDRQPDPPRRGWATPTYDEVLEKKRREEKNYRRNNDPYYDGGLRMSRSETNLNKPLFDPELDRSFRYLDREYEQKKVRFANEQRNPRLLEDPSWLDIATNPRQSALFDPYGSDFNSLSQRPPIHPPPRSHSHIERPPPRSHSQAERARPPETYYNERPAYNRPPQGIPPPDGTGATLAVGHESTASADQRRKEAYRRELQRQMQQYTDNKNRERQEDLRVNATGAYDVGRRPERHNLPEKSRYLDEPRYQQDSFSPRSIMFDDNRPARPTQGEGILEKGFTGLYEPYHLSQQPLPLSQPSLPYRAPADDPYNYYANRNPLESTPGLGGIGLDVPPPSNRPTYEKSPRRPDPTRDTGPARTPFPVDDKSNVTKEAQRQYQEELKRQIEEMKVRKQKEKEERERYDKKLDEEIRNYDPFGRGGGGAPMKDQQGNVIADLREMHLDNIDPNKKATPRYNPPAAASQPPPHIATDGKPTSDTYERGGHGIFGEPITDVEKLKRTRYQDDLRQQMEERKRAAEAEKEKQRQEDEKLLKKIEEDNRRMQAELEDEKRKEREKQEAAQRAQEELRRQQEEKKKEEEQRRREADDRRQQELRRQEEERRRQREKEDRDRRQPSPPVPAQKTQSRQSNRVASADVLNQLARMRQQLQNERKRVESDLKKEHDEPLVYDPRLQKPPPAKNVDIFDVARKKEPVTVRRHPSESNAGNTDDFQNLKYQDRDSRLKFRQIFPHAPLTNDALETQQRVLLKQQEDDISQLQESSDLDKMNPRDLGLLRAGSTGSATLLDSDSAFIDIPNGGSRASNYADLPPRSKRNDSARNRRRQRSETPKSSKPDQFGSLTSLDPDQITRKNDERLRKLKSITADDEVSLASADPDDILDRFMAKQQHTRPPSGQTLMDDSWLRPGTRVA